MTKFANMVRAFAREEDGIALTEYLILLGLLVGGVIISVAARWQLVLPCLGLVVQPSLTDRSPVRLIRNWRCLLANRPTSV